MHPINNLFKNISRATDFTPVFIQRLDAVLFLTPPTHEDFKIFCLEREQKYYNILDIIIGSIFEALMAANSSNKKLSTDASISLDIIYQSLEKIKNLVFFDNTQKKILKYLFLDEEFYPAEAWAIIGVDKNLDSKYKSLHLEIFKNKNTYKDITHEGILKLRDIKHEPENLPFLHEIIKTSDKKILCQLTYEAYKGNDTWLAVVTDCVLSKSFIDIEKADETLLIKKFLEKAILDMPNFQSFINNTSSFMNNLSKCCKEEDKQTVLSEVAISLPVSYTVKKNNETLSFIIKSLKVINQPYILIHALSDKFAEAEKVKIYELYDLSNISKTKLIVDTVNDKALKPEYLTPFLSLVPEAQHKEIVSYIISLDKKYFDICQPHYLSIKLNEKVLPEKPITQPKTFKI